MFPDAIKRPKFEYEFNAPYYRLFHGTSRAAANDIVAYGFRPLNWEATLDNLAAEQGVSVDELKRDASDAIVIYRRDEHVIHVTTHPCRARGIANNGSELRRKLLETVYRMRQPGASPIDARRWAAEKAAPDPVVIEIRIPRDDAPHCVRDAFATLQCVVGPGSETIQNVELSPADASRWLHRVTAVEQP
jgi:hypothetical protein